MSTGFYYGHYVVNALSKKADWLADTVTAILLQNTYTPDQDNHQWLSDIVAAECTATGYTRQTVGTKTLVYDATTNTTKLGCAAIAFTGLTGTGIRYLAVFHDTGVAGTSPLVGYVDFGTDQAPSAQTVTYTPPSSVFASLSVS